MVPQFDPIWPWPWVIIAAVVSLAVVIVTYRPRIAHLPPGQYLTPDFPVLSAGPTPHTPLDQWDFTIAGERIARPVIAR